IRDLHLLVASLIVPIKQIQRQLMRLTIGDVDIDGEAAFGEPAGGDTVAASHLLHGTRISRGVAPNEAAVAARADLSIAVIASGIADHVVAVAAVHPLPAPLGRRVPLFESSRARLRSGIDE